MSRNSSWPAEKTRVYWPDRTYERTVLRRLKIRAKNEPPVLPPPVWALLAGGRCQAVRMGAAYDIQPSLPREAITNRVGAMSHLQRDRRPTDVDLRCRS